MSRPILLNDVPASKRSTVFLSFFYQFEGNGDKPNPNDSLVLQFKKSDGSWITVWPLTGDVVLRQPNVFNQKYIQVTDEFSATNFNLSLPLMVDWLDPLIPGISTTYTSIRIEPVQV